MTTITFKVPPALARQLEAISIRKRMPKSKIIREVLSTAFKNEKVTPSLQERMKEGIGCFDSGKTDLATNPRHLKNYGKWRE